MKPKRKKTIMVAFRLDEETRKLLSIFCVENDTTLQKLLEDYIRDLLSFA